LLQLLDDPHITIWTGFGMEMAYIAWYGWPNKWQKIDLSTFEIDNQSNKYEQRSLVLFPSFIFFFFSLMRIWI